MTLLVSMNTCYHCWRTNICIVMEKETICEVGCLISSVAMALNGHQILVDGEVADPGNLNAWLRNNNGYLANDELKEGTLQKLSPNVKYVGKFCGKFHHAYVIYMLHHCLLMI